MPRQRRSLLSSLSCILATGATIASAAVIPRGIITDPQTFSSTQFDFVVVGGGTAGLTVAARLAENPSWNVGVIEVGQYRPNDPLIDVPKNFGFALGNSDYDWIYLSTPQANANNRVIPQNRGKVLGGSSAINFEIYNRPAAGEYSAWSALNLGASGWSWNGLLSYFQKQETYTPPPLGNIFEDLLPLRRRQESGDDTDDIEDPTDITNEFLGSAGSALTPTDLNVTSLLAAAGIENGLIANETSTEARKRSMQLGRRSPSHGTSGPVYPSYNTWYSDIAEPFIQTVMGEGIDINEDPYSGDNVGIYNSARSVDPTTQTRSYAATAYYAPNASKSNFIVLTGAQATKINFGPEDSHHRYTATGVDFVYDGTSYTVQASKEVILSGGVFNTPQLLELSGIGDEDLLSSLGINPLVDLPGVGENLQDHAMSPVGFVVKPGHHTWDELRNDPTFAADQNAEYASSKTGIMTSTISVLTFAPLRSFFSIPKVFSMISQVTSELLHNAHSFSWMEWAQYVIQLGWLYNPLIPQLEIVLVPGFQPTPNVPYPAANTSYAIITPVIQHPFSRGTVHINTTDPLAKPLVDPNYLDSVFDRTLLVEAVKYIRNLATTAPFSDVIESFSDPPASVTSDDDIAEYTRNALQSLKHPVGTCALAPRALDGVVDTDLLVYGTNNLRIADASIIPMQISAHTQVTAYAIGEKAADVIKGCW